MYPKHFTLQIIIVSEPKRTFAIFVFNNNQLFGDRGRCYHPYLFVFLQVAEPRKRSVTELTGVRGSGVITVRVDTDVGVDLRLRRKAGRCWCRAGGRRLATTTRVGPAILAMP